MNEDEVTLAARSAYEAVRAYRRQIGRVDMLPWIDAGYTKQTAYEQAVRDSARGKQRPLVDVEEVLIKAVTTALIEWRKVENDDSTRPSR